jgi:peptidoglycan/xylan/chitin deacetylase (PgdA/CDA1 family)
VIIEPNRRRRTRVFRALAGLVAVLFVGGVLASGWRPPAFAIGSATASPPSPTATTPPVAVVPTPQPTIPPPSPSPAPSPTQMPNGCWPPPADVAPAAVFSHAPRTTKVVALTFDDGTNSVNVHRILGILYRAKVNATFFPTGQSVHLFPDVWKGLAAASYPIANHTFSHRSLKGLCFQLQLAELLHDEQVVRDEVGVTMLPVMRPPYEEFDLVTRLAASAAGESHVVLWDIDTLDWTGISASAIARAALKGKAGSIILMHTSPVNTARALPEIISKFRKRGFTFVTIGQMLGIDGPVPFPPPSPIPSAAPSPTP